MGLNQHLPHLDKLSAYRYQNDSQESVDPAASSQDSINPTIDSQELHATGPPTRLRTTLSGFGERNLPVLPF